VGRYRKISVKIWNDDKFPFCSDDCKLVFVHLLTTPSSSPFGLYKSSLAGLAAEMRWPEKRYMKAFREALAKGFVKHDERALLIYLPNFLDHNPPESPNVIKSWGKLFDEIPDSHLKVEFFAAFSGLLQAYGKGFREAFEEAFREPFAKSMPNQEQEQEQEQERILSASGADAVHAEDGTCFRTKKGRKLTGSKLASFERFWAAFGYMRGKAEAADAWLQISLGNGELEKILQGAAAEAERRPRLVAEGKTPKMAQGWLTGRRWEDEDLAVTLDPWAEAEKQIRGEAQ